MINLFHHIKNANVNIFYFYHLSISNQYFHQYKNIYFIE